MNYFSKIQNIILWEARRESLHEYQCSNIKNRSDIINNTVSKIQTMIGYEPTDLEQYITNKINNI
jgi:hypothetical protein